MAKLRVRRKGYTRKAYVRKDGTRVKASRVGGSTFSVKDRGKKGRTPKSERWAEFKTKTGWSADMPMAERRSLALRGHKGDKLSAARGLQQLSNIQKRINPEVARKAKADAQYFYAQHRKSK